MSVQAMTWVLEDAPGLPPELFAVLMGYANHAAGDGSGAYPSQETLAKYARKSIRQVRRDTAALVAIGLLVPGDQRLVAHMRGDRRPVVYDLPLTVRADTDDRSPTTGRPRPRGHTGSPRPDTQGRTTGHPCPTNHPEPSTEPSFKTSRPIEPSRFDEFWAVYPRKVAKPKAQEAWAKALRKIGAEALIGAAASYRSQRAGQDPQFTLHPATWLNQERWADEPPPVVRAIDSRRPSPQDETDALFARAMERAEAREAANQ